MPVAVVPHALKDGEASRDDNHDDEKPHFECSPRSAMTTSSYRPTALTEADAPSIQIRRVHPGLLLALMLCHGLSHAGSMDTAALDA